MLIVNVDVQKENWEVAVIWEEKSRRTLSGLMCEHYTVKTTVL
jgi:hypothetical protein